MINKIKKLQIVSALKQDIMVCVVTESCSNIDEGLFLMPNNQIRQEKPSNGDKEFIFVFDVEGNPYGLFKKIHSEDQSRFSCEVKSDVAIWDKVYMYANQTI